MVWAVGYRYDFGLVELPVGCDESGHSPDKPEAKALPPDPRMLRRAVCWRLRETALAGDT